jgi:hypothetical protein
MAAILSHERRSELSCMVSDCTLLASLHGNHAYRSSNLLSMAPGTKYGKKIDLSCTLRTYMKIIQVRLDTDPNREGSGQRIWLYPCKRTYSTTQSPQPSYIQLYTICHCAAMLGNLQCGQRPIHILKFPEFAPKNLLLNTATSSPL